MNGIAQLILLKNHLGRHLNAALDDNVTIIGADIKLKRRGNDLNLL